MGACLKSIQWDSQFCSLISLHFAGKCHYSQITKGRGWDESAHTRDWSSNNLRQGKKKSQEVREVPVVAPSSRIAPWSNTEFTNKSLVNFLYFFSLHRYLQLILMDNSTTLWESHLVYQKKRGLASDFCEIPSCQLGLPEGILVAKRQGRSCSPSKCGRIR